MNKISGNVKVSPYKEIDCQDNISYGQTNEYSWGVVYDGAGSLELSGDAGAKIVYIAGILIQKGMELEEVYKIVKEYIFMFKDYKKMGGTLAMFKGNPEKMDILVVGDAFAVINSNNEWIFVTGEESVGEYANETKLITSKNTTPTIKSFNNVSGVCISSDGLDKLTIKNKKPFENFWNKAIKMNSELIIKFVEDSKRQDDDLGFVITYFD